MNVLVFVIALLMIISLLTYGRLESFRNFSLIQSEFEKYMQNISRKGVNNLTTSKYLHTHLPGKYKPGKTSQIQASSTLSLNLFVDKDERNQQAAVLAAHRQAAKNLMDEIYGNQPFFLKIEEKRPQVLDEILDSLIKASDEFSPKDKITRAKELATIDLGDDELNLLFTYMLKGQEAPLMPQIKDEEQDNLEPNKKISGYPSLLDFITIKKKKLVIRVFLASKPLLSALFGPETADQIIISRNELFKDVQRDTKTPQKASEEFKNLFNAQKLPYVPDTMLNFDVSKTNPGQYQ